VSDGATRRLRARIAPVVAELTLRDVEDSDGPSLTALIAAAYDEYACGPMDPERFDADLAAPRSTALSGGRRWWVVTRPDGGLVASVAHGPRHGPTVELHRLYLAPEARGRGLASLLLDGIAEEAERAGASVLAAWSDTRLVDAHRRYLASGFRATGETRELGDPAGTTELLFVRPIGDTTAADPA
jgi:GNAT superfamily N-acetyltransferase